ncbi:MAG: hypothetical protein HPY57_13865 [Ignavibacteria bacterium]|nr:hypothetical protein [Ignavibacteria bacterium]
MYICTIKNIITYKGIIRFDPDNKTKKHLNQADWKRMALVMIDGEISELYAWFIEKRYNLKLNKPLRGAHVSFINDSVNDIRRGLNCSESEAEVIWNSVKNKWDGKEIEISLSVDARSNAEHWWLVVPEEERKLLHSIRQELGLGRPYWGLHMSIGYANEKNIEHSKYILNLINKYGNEYN